MELPPCPHCGKLTGFVRKAYARGPIGLYYDESGEEADTWYDSLEFVPHSGAVRCDSCGRIRRDVKPEGRRVVSVY